MKVLITGGTGRLGAYVIREFIDAGHEVVLFARRKLPAPYDRLPTVLGDINSWDDCQRALEGGIHCVQHLAAQTWPSDHPEERRAALEQGIPFDATMRSNILGTYYLLQACLQAGVQTFVMTGSNCALGHGYRISQRPFPFCYLPVDESHPSDVEDSYSYTKLAGEELLASYTRAYGMRTYSIRAAGICNPQERQQMARKVRPERGWNDWLWCWVGSEDVASAHRLLMERAAEIEPHGVYFCNADDTTALEPSLELLKRWKPHLLPLVKDLPGHASFLSTARLRSLGWQHKTSWR
jgi:nucleoside-diphosphate-sugar epimerase